MVALQSAVCNGWKADTGLAPIVASWQTAIMMPSRLALLVLLLASACSPEPPKACSPPRSTWAKPRSFGLVVLNKIALDRTGALYWNGKPISSQALEKYLALQPTMDPEPWIFLETEMGAPCASLDAVRDQVERHMHCAEGGRCNEGIMTVWDNIPSPPGTPVS